ncbi:hypothetical protein H9P43_004738 [Blastocladiella emersonii ATCC 22665]|nr:hypothetical protein H9P43_004738 [Blastocladiella emersonii ATCC 22665]
MTEPPASLRQYDLTLDYYALLGVAPDADAAALKRGYYAMSRQLHPDKNPDNPDAAEQFQAIKVAYDMLTNESLREQYDAVLRQRREQEERVRAMDAAKRKLREDLEDRERAAMRAKRAKLDPRVLNRAAEIERLRSDNARRLRELNRAAVHREGLAASLSERVAAAASPAEHRTVKIKWDASLHPGVDEAALRRLMSAHGAVEEVLVRRGRTRTTGVVQFARVASARAVVAGGTRAHDDAFVKSAEAVSWASGRELPPEAEAGAGTGAGQQQVPDIAAFAHQHGFSMSVDDDVFAQEEAILAAMEATRGARAVNV